MKAVDHIDGNSRNNDLSNLRLIPVPPTIPQNLPDVKHRLFWLVALHPEGVTRMEIFEHLYGNDSSGGPFDHIVEVHINHLNAKIAPHGLKIRRDPPRRRSSKLQLRRLDNGHIWMPIAK